MAKLSTDKRKELKDSDFGIPEKRMYPLHDKEHVEAAVKMFGHASDEDKPQLARRILAKAKEYGMDSSGWDKVNAWAKKPIPKKKEETVKEQAVGIRKYTGDIATMDCLRIGNDLFVTHEDFETLAQEAHVSDHDTCNIVEFMTDDASNHLYDEYLKKYGIENHPVLAEPSHRHIMNRFFKEYAFDPSDETVMSGDGRIQVSIFPDVMK